MLQAGNPAPEFKLQNQDGKVRTLADYRGQWLVLYVYPKDDTPGCTLQGKSFTAQKSAFDTAGIKVVGLSPDDVASHRAFCDKFSFDVELLADTDTSLLKALGVGQSEWQGTMYWDRTTFVIDPAGKVRKVYENVDPRGHEQTLLADVKAMKN